MIPKVLDDMHKALTVSMALNHVQSYDKISATYESMLFSIFGHIDIYL